MNNIYDLIKTGEGYTLELKERFSSSIGKEICAFANASGGKIILGIKDSGEIIGFNLTNTIKSQIQDIARNMDPPLHVNVDSVDNIVVIYVPEGKEFTDFNENAFNLFVKNSGISSSLSKELILRNLGLFTEDKLNNSGVLFFSNFNDAVKFSLRNLIIEIFSDRVEISNPGGLLFDEKDFGKISFSRNPVLVDLVLRLGIVEKVGSGITRVREALKNNVVFEMSSDWFRVIIRRDNELGKISEKIIEETTQKTTQKILELLKQNPNYSRKALSELIEGITEDGIKYHLDKLKKEGKIKRIGPDKGGHWEVLE